MAELFVKPEEKDAAVAEAKTLPSLDISPLDMEWLQVLSEGWASPMKGYIYLLCLLPHFDVISKQLCHTVYTL